MPRLARLAGAPPPLPSAPTAGPQAAMDESFSQGCPPYTGEALGVSILWTERSARFYRQARRPRRILFDSMRLSTAPHGR
jgi:hypothetical protein